MLFWGNSVRRVHGSALRTALKWDLQGVHSRVAMKSWLWIDPVGWHVRPGWGKLLILHSQPQRTGRCWDLYCSLTRVVTIVTQGSSSSWQLGHLCPYCCRTARLESVPPSWHFYFCFSSPPACFGFVVTFSRVSTLKIADSKHQRHACMLLKKRNNHKENSLG